MSYITIFDYIHVTINANIDFKKQLPKNAIPNNYQSMHEMKLSKQVYKLNYDFFSNNKNKIILKNTETTNHYYKLTDQSLL